MIAILRAELPEAWLARYRRMCDGPTNVHAITVGEVDYLFDYCTELAVEREDRVVVAFGSSGAASGPRDASRIRGWPGSDERGDRGHFIAHAAGGALDVNLFHQDARLNRGWSPEGKRYREMERYCAEHPGTFCFSARSTPTRRRGRRRSSSGSSERMGQCGWRVSRTGKPC